MITILVIVSVTWAALFPVRRLLAAAGVIDLPNARSSHEVPTVRGGGLVTAAAMAIGIAATSPVGRASMPLAIALVAMMALGLLDDLRLGGQGLSWRARLGAQTAIALWMCATGIRLESVDLGSAGTVALGIFTWPITTLWIVGLVNAFNFMDGLDGMASLQATVIGTAGWLVLGRTEWGDVYLFVAAAALGFLPHNTPKARVFLGDAGSLPFGFAVAVASVGGARSAQYTAGAFMPLALLTGPIVVDTGATLLRRIAHRENVAEAHREHLYQRVQASGWSHASVSISYAAVTAACAACAMAWRWLPEAALAAWPALFVSYVLVRLRVMKRAAAQARTI